MPHGELITRATADIALTLALLGLALRLAPGGSASRAARWLWTVAAGVYLLHVAAAFYFVHHFSHQAALEHTAQRTAQLFGIATGVGLWVNYAFTLAWLADVVAWWTRPLIADKLRWPTLLWLAFFVFITVNATIVFETGLTRWYFATLLGVVALHVGRRSPTAA